MAVAIYLKYVKATEPFGGAIVLVGTPIGNLGDISKRALDTLEEADLICCEDTRRTRKLLSSAGITGKKLVTMEKHNERDITDYLVRSAQQGNLVAVVSDAGMPLLSDPGEHLVRTAYSSGVRVLVVPGPDSVTSALVVSGIGTDRYCFEGFLPRRGVDRVRRLDDIAVNPCTVVIFESPRRVRSTLADLARVCGEERAVSVVRELTKVHEEIWRGNLQDACKWIEDRDNLLGEVVIVLAGNSHESEPVEEALVIEALHQLLQEGVSVSAAVAEVSAQLGIAKRRAYSLALDLRKNS